MKRPRKDLDLPLDIRGTAFQQRVWKALTAIPAGKTASYAEIARKIGKPSAVRAVAQACAANNLAIAIPCHRVVRTDGGLSGYRWGVARKRKLLDREAVMRRPSADPSPSPRAGPGPDPRLKKAFTPTPLPGGEGRTGSAAHPFSLGETVAP